VLKKLLNKCSHARISAMNLPLATVRDIVWRMWKKVKLNECNLFNFPHYCLLVKLRKTTEMTGLWTEVGTCDVWNTKQECYYLGLFS
jgi:hypothetical protein